MNVSRILGTYHLCTITSDCCIKMPMDVYLSKMVPVRNGAALFMTFIRM